MLIIKACGLHVSPRQSRGTKLVMKKWNSVRRRLFFSIFTINLFYVLLGLENLHFIRCIRRKFMDWLHQHLLDQSVTELDQSLLIFSLFCRLLSLGRIELVCTHILGPFWPPPSPLHAKWRHCYYISLCTMHTFGQPPLPLCCVHTKSMAPSRLLHGQLVGSVWVFLFLGRLCPGKKPPTLF